MNVAVFGARVAAVVGRRVGLAGGWVDEGAVVGVALAVGRRVLVAARVAVAATVAGLVAVAVLLGALGVSAAAP
jgi:hypothetical protein